MSRTLERSCGARNLREERGRYLWQYSRPQLPLARAPSRHSATAGVRSLPSCFSVGRRPTPTHSSSSPRRQSTPRCRPRRAVERWRLPRRIPAVAASPRRSPASRVEQAKEVSIGLHARKSTSVTQCVRKNWWPARRRSLPRSPRRRRVLSSRQCSRNADREE